MKNKIPFKSVLTRFKNIKSRNNKFNSLNDKDKRREIAYEALMLVINYKVRASGGNGSGSFYWGNALPCLVLKHHLQKFFKSC